MIKKWQSTEMIVHYECHACHYTYDDYFDEDKNREMNKIDAPFIALLEPALIQTASYKPITRHTIYMCPKCGTLAIDVMEV